MARVNSEKVPSLVDSFNRKHNYLRISLTERCNLRCDYCMPENGVELTSQEKLLNKDEIVRAARIFVEECGVDKVRLTGGEPLLRKDIIDLCADIKRLDGLKDLGITTNGILLKRRLPDLLHAGVNLFNVSLDTLDEEKFARITKRRGLPHVLDAISHAVDLGVEPLKVNCVVMRGVNDDEIEHFVSWTKYMPVEMRFIEFMPFHANGWSRDTLVPFREMVKRIKISHPSFKRLDDTNDSVTSSKVAKVWQVPGHAGTVGFITSMSQQFCGSCNRLRMMADGNLKVCLFGSREYDLGSLLRSSCVADNEIVDAIRGALDQKHAALGGSSNVEELLASSDLNRSMVRIGG